MSWLRAKESRGRTRLPGNVLLSCLLLLAVRFRDLALYLQARTGQLPSTSTSSALPAHLLSHVRRRSVGGLCSEQRDVSGGSSGFPGVA